MKFLNNIDLQKNEIQNFRVQNLAAAPSNPVLGQHYFNTVDKTEYVYNGTKWIDALSQGDYTFKNGVQLVEGTRDVQLTAATKDAIGGVIVGDNIDVNNGTISVKSGNKQQAGLVQLATDAEAAAGTEDTKAVTAKQVETQIQKDIELKIELTDLSAEGPITYNEATGKIGAEFDAEATAESNKLMKSGAIKAELDKKLDKTTFEGAKLSDFEDDSDVHPIKEAGTLTGLTATAAELNTLDGITASTAELNILDGVTADATEINVLDGILASTAELNTLKGITATTEELNILDGVTATYDEINVLDGIEASTDELNIMHGVTATTAEINTLDGITATTAELNKLHGVTADTAEINVLDGITATTEELNQIHESGAVKADLVKLHAITVTADQINAIAEVDTEDLQKLADITASAEEINILDGATLDTAELNILDGATVTTDELNVLDGIDVTTAELNALKGIEGAAEELNQLDGIEGNVQELLDTKVDKNDAIEAGTKCKITYDAKGLVTGGEDLVLADIPDLSSVYVNVNRIGKANGVASLDDNVLLSNV